ncbi:MAG: type II toxin-antitoxin system Phd/YefM family antitoxin [Syntrophomonadaceae bacterium]|jgi:antitoxin Phd|nr:type II toxin-antitoxin system Phd/YefM family antitoxin [Syntrophomonadaceae bacterium]
MIINTKNLVSISEANQNFSKVARLVDENGAVVILKNNVPKYVLLEYTQLDEEPSDNEITAMAQNIITRNIAAFKELAK